MKNKIILLILMLISLTGCSINYNLTIDEDNNYIENIAINSIEKDNYKKDTMFSAYLEEYPIYYDEEFLYYKPTEKLDNYTYYNKEYEELPNGYNFLYNAQYLQKDYSRARSLKTAFKDVDIVYFKEDKSYYIALKNCLIFDYNNNIDAITVNVNFKNAEVIENNADSINNNVYTWHINKNSNILIKYRLKENEKQDDMNVIIDNNKNDKSIFIALGIFLAFILVLILLINLKKRFK